MIEYIVSHFWQIWLIIAVVCLIAELSTGGFFILCFSIGAVAAMILALVSPSITSQILVFAITSAICLFFVRPFIKKYFHGGRHDDGRVSNAEAIVGRIGTVSETIQAGGYGRVAIDGDDWKALSNDGSEIKKGEKVKVLKIDSIIITVERTLG